MSGTFVYIIGVPGSGKSTLMAELTRGLPVTEMSKPIAHRWYGDGKALELGRQRASFSGTDALSLSVQPRAMEFIEQHPARLILAEGDRLANDKFFCKIVDSGYEFHLVYLMVDPWEASARRAKRGSNQNAGWLAGRETKVHGLLDRWPHLTLGQTAEPAWHARALRQMIPALEILA